MYGPDATFLGVAKADIADPRSLADKDIVIVGAPFDGGPSHRPGARFGPQAIRFTDYLPHNGSRPHPAPGGDPLVDPDIPDVREGETPARPTGQSQRRLQQ